MFLTDDLLTTDEAAERQTWRDPLRRLAALDAEVAERWLVTARLPCSRFRELVPPGFLEAQTVGGTLVLTLCAVRIRHAAPAWAPLHLGPASMNCALRIACRDRRDGSPCAWVSHRYTSSALAPALAGLGLPHIAGGLIERGDEVWQYGVGYTSNHGDQDYRLTHGDGEFIRFVQRKDGFVSVDAREGRLVTIPVKLEAKTMTLNADTGASGQIGVRLLDDQGRLLDGFESEPVAGNGVSLPVVWRNGRSIAALSGKAVRIECRIGDARLFGMVCE